ncbi:MAG: YceI family protein [Pseudomonadota bacterium]
MFRLLIMIGLVFGTLSARADWTLDPVASSLTFASVKNGSIVEPHRFGSLSGNIDASGEAVVTVALDSVDTLIPIRDERMRDLLFEVKQFPTATFRAKVEVSFHQTGAVGTSSEFPLEGELTIHGVTIKTSVPVKINRVSTDRVQVLPVRPLILSVAQFGMGEGLEALRKIAGLESIGPAVPVSFLLVFQRSS